MNKSQCFLHEADFKPRDGVEVKEDKTRCQSGETTYLSRTNVHDVPEVVLATNVGNSGTETLHFVYFFGGHHQAHVQLIQRLQWGLHVRKHRADSIDWPYAPFAFLFPGDRSLWHSLAWHFVSTYGADRRAYCTRALQSQELVAFVLPVHPP